MWIIFVSLFASAFARPGLIGPLTLALAPGAAVGPDGRVLDTPAVAVAKAEHAAAHLNERINLATEAARSLQLHPGPLIVGASILAPGAAVGPDGRVVDTPEVAVAKAAHATAHVNERINLANEAARSGALVGTLVNVGLVDGRVIDTPEVAQAQAAHLAAQVNGRVLLANEAAQSSGLVIAVNGISSVAPLGPDGRVRDTAEVAVAKAAHAAAHVNEKINLANEAARSADVVLAAPALTYARLV